MMKRMLMVLAVGASLSAAAGWKGLTDANHYAGPKLAAEELDGKVVLVDEWGVGCPRCVRLLPKLEKIWQSWKDKPFVLLGSHRHGRSPDRVAELVRSNALTYPVYEGAGLAPGEPPNGGGIPFLYVVNARGEVVYRGNNEDEAVEAVTKAVAEAEGAWSLTGNMSLRQYADLADKLVLGKPVKTVLANLKADIRKGSPKNASETLRRRASEAQGILMAVDATKEKVAAEIERLKKTDPARAVALMRRFVTTFPSDRRASAYKTQMRR